MIDKLDQNVLSDDTQLIWSCISEESNNGNRIVDIILDNSGYELFTDLLVAEYIIDKKLASKVRFNAKALPWFISDVMSKDFNWSLEYLSQHKSPILSEVGKKWIGFLNTGEFELCPVDYFWTLPYEFHR